MKNNEIISMIDLQLFADGGAAGGTAAGTGAGGTGVTASAAGVQTGVKGNQQTGTPAADGAPAAEVQNQTEQTNPADLNAEFEALIKGKFKDQYNARVKDTVQKRVKGLSEAAEKYKSLAPALAILAENYGFEDATDTAALVKAVMSDNSLMEDAALEHNMPTPQYREKILNELELKEFRQREAAERQYQVWMQQAEEAKPFYPSLDLHEEAQNPKFMELLRSNIDVRTAYEVIHKDDIIAGAMQAAAQTAAQKVANSVAANAARPRENGSGQGAATVNFDVSKMTKAQRQEYVRRAKMGEKITFR
jgi:hypothetical protein